MPSECIQSIGSNYFGFLKRSAVRIILIVFIACSGISHSYAQKYNYKVERIPLENELYGFSGTCILQDREGFMWFGSYNGLYRYDGKRFLKYVNDPEDSTSISNNEIEWILEDDEGTIWVSTASGLNKIEKSTGTFEFFPNPGILEINKARNAGGYFIQGSDGYLYVGNRDGLYRFDRRTGQFKRLYSPDESDGLQNNGIFYLFENKKGDIWVRELENDLYLLHKETEEFIQIVPEFNYYMHQVFEDASGRTWITSLNEIYHYFPESNVSVPYLKDLVDPGNLKYLRFMHLLEDRDGTFWVNTCKSLHNLDQDMNEIYHWDFPRALTPSLPIYQMIMAVYEDQSGNIWFFTEDAINKVVKEHANFKVYDLFADDQFHVKDILTESSTSIWISDGNYVFNMDPETDSYEYNFFSPMIKEISCIHIDRKGNIWVGVNGSGLFKGVKSQDGTIHFENCFSDPKDSTNLPGLKIIHMFEDSHERIWISTVDHLPCYLDPEKNRIIHLQNNPDLEYHLAAGAMIHCENAAGELMASSQSRVYSLNSSFINVTNQAVTFMEINSISPGPDYNFDNINTIYQSEYDPSKAIWILSEGLVKYDPGPGGQSENKEGKFTRYNSNDGLPTNDLRTILEDREGILWIGTNSGLVKFDPVKETFTLYTQSDGLPNNAFSVAAAKSRDGKFFFGTQNGFISFHPDSIEIHDEVPPVFLTDLKINNESYQYRDDNNGRGYITFVDSIRLRYHENNIHIEYAALDFVQTRKIQYEYKLEGQDREWIYAGNRSEVNYTNLDPGKYTFRVKGSNHRGIWNEEGASLQIMIRPPPWRAWWAFVIYGIILVLLVRWYRSYLLARAKLKTELEVERVEKEKVLEMDHMRSRFFANISHEFRTPLTLILGPIEDAAKKRSERIELNRDIIGMMHRNARRLQQLISQLLDVSKLETGKMMLQVSKGNFEELVKTIVISCESLAESKQIKFTFDIPETSGSLYFDRDKVEKVISNLLSNAFKFTSAGGEVNVTLRYDASDGNQFAEIVVSDTGKGIPAEKQERIFDRFFQVNDSETRTEEGSGIGLALTKEMVDLYRGEITVESILGKGSSFRVKLPVSIEQFHKDEIVEVISEVDVVKEVADRGMAQEEQTEIESSEQAGQGKPKDAPIILVVEDNGDLSQYIFSILEFSYRVLTAQDGLEGLERATESIPDLVISDVMMPQMDGMEMCSKLKSDERTSHIPVILLTARADRGSKLEGLETGADDYIIKPFDAEELKVRVRNMIEQRKKLMEKFRKEFVSDSAETGAPPGDQILEKLMTILNQHLADPEFNIAQLPDELNMSRAQMFRKVTAITGYTPKDLIRNMRLKKAASLFRSGHHHVALVMHQVGFNNQSHFGACFSKLYGLTPSEYIRSSGSQSIHAE